MNPPLLSVAIVTYQHAPYIRQCVEGVLAQETTFPVEILIGEDESTDGTREICQELAAAHPGRIRVLLHRRQDVVCIDGRPRGGHNFRATLGEAQGEFIAYVEGDDYWTDPTKLQRQVEYLRANPDCTGCFHESSLVDSDGRELRPHFFRSEYDPRQEKFDQRDCLTHLQSKYPTCSLLFRRSALRGWPAWYLRRPCDFYFDLLLTAHGKLGFLDRNMAAYRRHGGGVWSGLTRIQQVLEPVMRYRLLLADAYFLETYRDDIFAQLAQFESMIVPRDELAKVEAEANAKFAETHARNGALLDELKARLQRALEERERLLAFVTRQHALIQELKGGRPAEAPAAMARS
jgi:glycosyltransferase involved in cell wall biosynthesis